MKTAEAWRHEYYVTRGKPITPSSLLADILASMEEWEAEVRFLTAELDDRTSVAWQEEADRQEQSTCHVETSL